MRLLPKRNPADDAAAQPPEDEDVRRFRFILRTAPREAKERLTEEALTTLDDSDKQDLLVMLQHHAAVGDRIRHDNVAALARAICLSEARDPGVLFTRTSFDLMRRLARGALASPMSSDLTAGYEDWGGEDPHQEPEVEWKDDAYGKKFDAAMRQRRKESWGQGGPGM